MHEPDKEYVSATKLGTVKSTRNIGLNIIAYETRLVIFRKSLVEATLSNFRKTTMDWYIIKENSFLLHFTVANFYHTDRLAQLVERRTSRVRSQTGPTLRVLK